MRRLLAPIDGRDTAKPFFTFFFFESPHARYHFPPEDVIRRPYVEELDRVTTDTERNIDLIKSRHVNSCHHLVSRFARVLSHVERRGLLDSTIVVIAGDHDEEFLEHGRRGHNSASSRERLRVPLILSIP